MSAISRRSFMAAAGSAPLLGCQLGPLVSQAARLLPSKPSPGRAPATAPLERDEDTRVWAARGGAERLELTRGGVVVHVPTRSPLELSVEGLRLGYGREAIRRHFGQPTLSALLEAIG